MELLTIAFVGCLIGAHVMHGSADVLHLELSFFREGDSWLFGYLLFAILFAMGLLLIIRLARDPDEQSSFTICAGVFGLLIVVAATPSMSAVHLFSSLAILAVLYLLYACVLNELGYPWLTLHLLSPFFMLAVPPHGFFGSWEKGMILYLVVLINAHYRTLPPMERTAKPAGRRRTKHYRAKLIPASSVSVPEDQKDLRLWRRLPINRRSARLGR